MVEQLIARVFCTRDNAHLSHWKTPSYAEHMALGDFYEDILEQLKADVVWVHKNYEALCHNVTPLKNILDELLAHYLRTIYKLRFLK